jgi:hypothetical protein
VRKKAEQGATVLETLFGGSPGNPNGVGVNGNGQLGDRLDSETMMPIAGIFGKSSPLTTGPLARFVDTSGYDTYLIGVQVQGGGHHDVL